MKIRAAALSDKGCTRANNEDNIFLDGSFKEKDAPSFCSTLIFDGKDGYQIFAVCDGMGGESDGETAAYIAVSALVSLKEKLQIATEENIGTLIDAYTEEVNQTILAYGKQGHMGTTLVLLLIFGNKAYIAHMGDSRIYLIRENEIIALTSDHSEAGRLLALGFITEEQYRTHPMKNVITRYLGMYYPDLTITAAIQEPIEIRRKDRFLLCSDGLSDLISTQQILQIASGKSTSKAADDLLVSALTAGGIDNVTVMIVDMGYAGKTRQQIKKLAQKLLFNARKNRKEHESVNNEGDE